MNKVNEFCSELKESEQTNKSMSSTFCKERSPIEYYNCEKGIGNGIKKCRCTNQELLIDEFCEICNAYIF